jgi:hypothetical protein
MFAPNTIPLPAPFYQQHSSGRLPIRSVCQIDAAEKQGAVCSSASSLADLGDWLPLREIICGGVLCQILRIAAIDIDHGDINKSLVLGDLIGNLAPIG